MLDNVLRNLISVKHSVKNPKTCLLFPSLMNNDWFVWIACKTLLDSRTQIWANVGPRILIVCNFFFFNCFFVVGLVWPSRPTLFYQAMLDGVLRCCTRLDGSLTWGVLLPLAVCCRMLYRRLWHRRRSSYVPSQMHEFNVRAFQTPSNLNSFF